MRRLSPIIFFTLIVSTAYGADVGTTSANFLQLAVGPRAVAMGESQVGAADDVYATYWNPAGLARLQVHEAGFVQNQYLENISEQYAAYALPRPALGTFAGSVTFLSVGQFQGYDATGQATQDVGSRDAALGLSFARTVVQNRRMGSSLSAGITAKYIEEQLDTARARAYAADAGLLFVPGRRWSAWLEPWKLGLVLRNFGTPLHYDRDSAPLPRSLEAGLSYTGHWRDEAITGVLDGRQPRAGSRSVGVGLEVNTLQFVVVRMGYTSAGDLGNGLRFGGGLRFKTAQLDYAYAGAGEFGGVHRIGLTLRFGKLPQDPQVVAQRWYEKGMKDYRRRRFTEALVEFNKALEVDPSHPDALKLMKKTYDEIKTLVPE